MLSPNTPPESAQAILNKWWPIAGSVPGLDPPAAAQTMTTAHAIASSSSATDPKSTRGATAAPQTLPKFVKVAGSASTTASVSRAAPASAGASGPPVPADASQTPTLTSAQYRDMYLTIIGKLLKYTDPKSGREIGKQFSEAVNALVTRVMPGIMLNDPCKAV